MKKVVLLVMCLICFTTGCSKAVKESTLIPEVKIWYIKSSIVLESMDTAAEAYLRELFVGYDSVCNEYEIIKLLIEFDSEDNVRILKDFIFLNSARIQYRKSHALRFAAEYKNSAAGDMLLKIGDYDYNSSNLLQLIQLEALDYVKDFVEKGNVLIDEGICDFAIRLSSLNVVQYLINRGHKVERPAFATSDCPIEILDWLVFNYFKPDDIFEQEMPFSPIMKLPLIHRAASRSCKSLEHIINAGVDINMVASEIFLNDFRKNITPLGAAIEGNNVDSVKLLLSKGADTSIIPEGDYSSLYDFAVAVQFSNPALLKN